MWVNESSLVLRNRMSESILPGQYNFTFQVTNPEWPDEARNWWLDSYSRDLATETYILDSGMAPGFGVNERLGHFRLEPLVPEQQNSGDVVTLRFAFILSSELQSGDLLLVRGPHGYFFQCPGFLSFLLPPPTCSRSAFAFSFAGVPAALVPVVSPAGAADATVVEFRLDVLNPNAKPANNVLEFMHCRGASQNITIDPEGQGCPAPASIVSSLQYPFWQVIPQLDNISVSLLTPEIRALNQSSSFVLRFLPASVGSVRVRVACAGMDFIGCIADSAGVPVQCIGQMGAAMLLLSGEIIAGRMFEINVRRVINPTTPGPTTWSTTTYGSQGQVVDESSDYMGYTVLRYLGLDRVTVCQPDFLINLNNPEANKSLCTARYPWYQQQGNTVILRFKGLSGGDIMNGHRLLVQPPEGYTFPNFTVGALPVVLPLAGFPGTSASQGLAYYKAQVADLALGGNITGLSAEALLIPLTSGKAMPGPFSMRLKVNNPAQDPAVNLWRVMLLSPTLAPLYTNDAAWTGFQLYGTFQDGAQKTSIKWLVSNFPSEPNVVRLRVFLFSPLQGKNLMLKVQAPAGFNFDKVCLPSDAELIPAPGGVNATPAWVSSCTAERTDANIAFLVVSTDLGQNTEYAANLVVTNAAVDQPDSVWELFTFRNNDLLSFVHYTLLPSFSVQVMEAAVIPEMPRFATSSMIHVSLTPQRDLGPYGQLIVTAPNRYLLFCRLRPFFFQGNLPTGTSCSGANNYAIIQLSGGDSLDRGSSYYFAVRVTNPSEDTYNELINSGASLLWGIRLQTKDRELVHETTQVPGYNLAHTAISRLAVAASTTSADLRTWVHVQFKLETELLRFRRNVLELTAPRTVLFTCAEELLREGYVLPASAILSANIARFGELGALLESPPSSSAESFRSEGQTEDGRHIVDCSLTGRVSIAVELTDSTTLGRYAFSISVRNPSGTPAPNVWTIKIYQNDALLEQGSTSGYEVTPVGAVSTGSLGLGMISGAVLGHHGAGCMAVALALALVVAGHGQ